MGTFHKDSKGYPRWNNSNQLVHRTVSRPSEGQVVHHKDGDTGNFRKSNLVNMSPSGHSRLHAKQKRSLW